MAQYVYTMNRVSKIVPPKREILKDISLSFFPGAKIGVLGLNGSGKSTLINDTLLKLTSKTLNNASDEPAPYDEVIGLHQLDKVIAINQSPIGRTPRSNPATYTGIFTPVRELFANTPESRARRFGPNG